MHEETRERTGRQRETTVTRDRKHDYTETTTMSTGLAQLPQSQTGPTCDHQHRLLMDKLDCVPSLVIELYDT